jgi:ABC-type nitrate/sulfonate/bicarbonate transport system permease component
LTASRAAAAALLNPQISAGGSASDPPEVTEASTRAGRSTRWRSAVPTLVGAASLLAGIGIWQLYGALQENSLFVPTFTQTIAALWGQVQTAEFWQLYGTTLQPFLYGWILAIVLGIPLGLIMGYSRVVKGLIGPYMSFFNALPVTTLVPIVVIALGIDLPARVTVVFLFAFIDVVLTSAAGMRYVEKDQVDMARSFGFGPIGVFRKVALPSAVPGMMAAIRIGTGRAIVGMVVMELLLVTAGVGKLITRYKDYFMSADLYAVVLSLAIFGLVLMNLTKALEKRALRWRPSNQETK